jgi:hypothetical protein
VIFSIFRAFNTILELFLALKINSKKEKPILVERAEPEGPTRSGPLGPRVAHRPEVRGATAGRRRCLGVRARGSPVPRAPIKGDPRALRVLPLRAAAGSQTPPLPCTEPAGGQAA